MEFIRTALCAYYCSMADVLKIVFSSIREHGKYFKFIKSLPYIYFNDMLFAYFHGELPPRVYKYKTI